MKIAYNIIPHADTQTCLCCLEILQLLSETLRRV